MKTSSSAIVVAVMLCAYFAVMLPGAARAAEFIETEMSSFGTFLGNEYVQYRGRFMGSTAAGEFDVPFEIVAPANHDLANGIIVFEPPHFAFGSLSRDLLLGRDILFNRGYVYATVGWSGNGLSVLDPTAAPIIIGGQPLANPGQPDILDDGDEEILIQFNQALRNHTFVSSRAGTVDVILAVGSSQTSAALLNLGLNPESAGLIDLYLLVATLWEPIFVPEAAEVFPRTKGEFDPAELNGKALFVMTEGDLLISRSSQLLNSIDDPDTRLYQIAGGAHTPLTGALGIRDQLPFEANGLDWTPVVRAAFINADRWVRFDDQPPPDQLFVTTTEVDPVYDIVTGIARDENLNALGGVRLPRVEVGHFAYTASLLDFELQPGLPGLIGVETDLECVPQADGSERFPFTALYDWRIALQVVDLLDRDLLLKNDGIPMIFTARDAEIGRDSRCDSTTDPG